MAEQKQEDVDTLKRRGRRRLVGAVALVLLAVIVLPMVFDPEPRKSAPPVSVRIPGEEETPFNPKMAPRVPEPKAEEKAAPPKPAVEEKKAAPPVAEKKAPEPAPEPRKAEAKAPEPRKPEPKSGDAERARAEAALAGEAFIVPVGAYANPDPVIAKLAEAKVRHYTEKVATAKGDVTRVRAGPFPSREEADKALEKLKGLGLKPGNVVAKSG